MLPDLVDAVVVGGGIMGAAITFALARRNLRVVLLEAQRIGSGATGNGFAWVNATYKIEDEAYFRLNAQGVASYDRLASEWGAERLGIHAGGALFWTRADDAPGIERLRRRAHRLQEWNYPAALLNSAELAALEPNAALGEDTPLGFGVNPKQAAAAENAILFAPADKWVDTTRLCRFFIEQAQTHRAEIRLNCPATGFTRSVGNAISTVETPQGRIATHLLVLAAGLHTPALITRLTGDVRAANHFPIRAEPGLLIETPPVSPEQICARILYPPDMGGLHLRPTPAGSLLIGAEDVDNRLRQLGSLNTQAMQIKSVSEAVPETLRNNLIDRAARALPGLSSSALYATSTPRLCVRPVPADGFPIAGALPGVPNAYIAVTHSGVTLAPLLAELLTGEIFTRAASPLLDSYRPDRFAPR